MTTDKKFYRDSMMDLTNYRLEPAALDGDWDRFVQWSPQGTLFCESVFASALQGEFLPYWVLKKNEPKAAVLLLKTEQTETGLHELLIHSGPMMAASDGQQNGAQTLSEEFRVLSFLASKLADYFKVVEFATHPALRDLRPFLWHNYGEDLPKYTAELCYTAYLDIADAGSDCALNDNRVYHMANKSRRQEIRYAAKAGVRTTERFDADLFRRFYELVFQRQQLVPTPSTEEIVGVMRSLHEAGRLRMFVSETSSGEIGSIAVFGIDTKRAYYLYGANDPALRDGHTGTAVLWDSFRALSSDTDEVDLEGVNSPMRGYFKLSFGAELHPYYHVKLDN